VHGRPTISLTRAPTHPRLRGLVEQLWAVGLTHELGDEWMLPSGRIHVALRPCATPICIDGQRLAPAVVGGLRTRAYVRQPTRPGSAGSIRSVGAVLAPGAAAALLGVPAGALRGCHVELSDLWGSGAQALLDTLIDAGDDQAELLIRFEAALLARLDAQPHAIDAPMQTAAAAMAAGVGVATIASELGLSERRLRDRFQAAIGLGPRDYARVARLNRLLRLAKSQQSWAELALAAGYCDQAHMCREFRALTGMTPSRYRPGASPLHVPLPNRPSQTPALVA